MADILIRGVQFPTMAQAYKTLIVSYDGKVYEGVYPQPTAKKKEPIANAVELPEHGDLIDRDAFMNDIQANDYPVNVYGNPASSGMSTSGIKRIVNNAPVIVPADKEETE